MATTVPSGELLSLGGVRVLVLVRVRVRVLTSACAVTRAAWQAESRSPGAASPSEWRVVSANLSPSHTSGRERVRVRVPVPGCVCECVSLRVLGLVLKSARWLSGARPPGPTGRAVSRFRFKLGADSMARSRQSGESLSLGGVRVRVRVRVPG